MTQQNTTPTTPFNYETFSAQYAELLADARANGQAPPDGHAVISGMGLIVDLYKQHPATPASALLCVALAECLHLRYPEFGSAFLAVANALDSKYDTTISEVSEVLSRLGLDATFGETFAAVDLRSAMESPSA